MSAVPAGSLARLLLTYARLVEGGRLQRRRQQSVRPARKEKGRLVPAGRPAEEAWKARVERVRQLELREGVTSPAMGGEAVGRTVRRRQRAVGLQGGWNADNTDACCSGRNSGGGGNDGAAGSGVGGGSDRNGVDGGGCDWGCEDCSGDCAGDGGGDVSADVCGDGEGGGVEGGSGGEVGFGGEAERGSGKVHGGEGGEGALRGTQRSGMYVRAFAGWDAGGRELPHRRLVSEEGLVRPRALRAVPLATRAAFGSGTHYGSTGRGAEAELSEPAAWAGRVRRLELPRLCSEERGNRREEGGDSPASRVERGAGGGVAWVRAGLRVVCASALRTAAERLGVNRAGAPVLAAAAQGQHELEEDKAIDLHRASPDGAGTTGGEQDSARDGTVKAAEDDLGSSKSEMSDIDVRSRQERESGGFFRGVRARVRSAFGDG